MGTGIGMGMGGVGVGVGVGVGQQAYQLTTQQPLPLLDPMHLLARRQKHDALVCPVCFDERKKVVKLVGQIDDHVVLEQSCGSRAHVWRL
jgi:hypothetical protein